MLILSLPFAVPFAHSPSASQLVAPKIVSDLTAGEVALATAPANSKIATAAAKVEASRPTPHQQFQTLALRAADRALKTTKKQLRISAREARLAKQAALVNAARKAKKAFGVKKTVPKQKKPVGKAPARGPVAALRQMASKTAAAKLMRLAQFEHNNPAAAIGAALAEGLKAKQSESALPSVAASAPPSTASSAYGVGSIPKPETPEDRARAAAKKRKEAREQKRKDQAAKRRAAKAARIAKRKAAKAKKIADQKAKADAAAFDAALKAAAAKKAAPAAAAKSAKTAAPAKTAIPAKAATPAPAKTAAVPAAAAKTATPTAVPTKQSKAASPPAGTATTGSSGRTLEVWQIALMVIGSLIFFAAMFMLWRAVAPASGDELGPPRDSIL